MDKPTIVALTDAFLTTLALLAANFLEPKTAELVRALVVTWQGPTAAIFLYYARKEGMLLEDKLLVQRLQRALAPQVDAKEQKHA